MLIFEKLWSIVAVGPIVGLFIGGMGDSPKMFYPGSGVTSTCGPNYDFEYSLQFFLKPALNVSHLVKSLRQQQNFSHH